jgi:hypothetical protein
MLDLSAAFDTIDHKVLMKRLKMRYGIQDRALQWVQSYLSQRVQRVLIEGIASDDKPLEFGVPQGSVLGPVLFTLYTAPLGDVIASHGVNYHVYADDTQLYVDFHIDSINDEITKIQNCLKEIKEWMNNNFLKLNDGKTELIILGTKQMLLNLPEDIIVKLGTANIIPAKSAKNLGVVIDPRMSMSDHITTPEQVVGIHSL